MRIAVIPALNPRYRAFRLKRAERSPSRYRSLTLPTRRIVLSAAFAFCAMVMIAKEATAQGVTGDSFVASESCPAFQSIRKGTNPGEVSTVQGIQYEIIDVNGNDPTHYRIRMPEARPQERWVAMECGSLASASSVQLSESPYGDPRGANALAEALGGPSGKAAATAPSEATDQQSPSGTYVLAANWHPAFCELRPRSRDCRSGGMEDGFKLHGLWPQPRNNEYCDVSRRDIAADQRGQWRDLPEPQITMATEQALAKAMPGMVADLHKHEWIKHGTCYEADAEEYFTDSLALVEKLNASPVGKLFRSNRGRELTSEEVRAVFDDAFGRGAGKRVLVDCNDDDGRSIINELQVNLEGEITPESDLGDLILNASTSPPGCRSGIVDRSGSQ
ncbi:probable ribonuclease [Fulvimarina pelagi HTCC2506]|uniref:Probable ribonuclease n=1 Tax=Fulvimarina pelagi HTCC2506 TaxID=314231 RepID=Q0G3C0_9HYPH|nr:probable ribonuclease [Fulvimarina pelagi HTCC2506]